MADQNSTTLKQQKWNELEAGEMIPDSMCAGVIARYVAALADMFIEIDFEKLAPDSADRLKHLHFFLVQRMQSLIEINEMKEEAV